MRGSANGRDHQGGRRRRRLAVFVLGLWVLGFELLPNLHVAVHDRLASHRHDGDDPAPADGLRVRVRYGSHRHDDGTWHADAGRDHAAARDKRAPHRDGLGDVPAPRGHGRHSLAHRGLAIPTPAPVVTAPLPVTRSVSWIEIDRVVAPRSRAVPVAFARGPPVA